MDLDSALLPHLKDAESMNKMIQLGVRSEWVLKSDCRHMFDVAVDYFVRSEFKQTVTQGVLEQESPGWWSQERAPEEPVTIEWLVEKLRERYRRNSIQDAMIAGGRALVDDPEEALNTTLADLARIQFDSATLDRSEPYALHYNQRVAAYFEQLDETATAARSPRGVHLLFPEITEEVYGLKPSEFAILAGAPGTGKSWAMCQVALAAALNGHRAMLVSLENSKDMTLMRLDCLLTGVPYKQYERGKLDLDQTEMLKRGRELLDKLQLDDMLIVDCPRKSAERTVFEIYSRARFHGVEIVSGDQLSWVTAMSGHRGERRLQVKEVTDDIVEFTKEFNLASIWASQYNRTGAKSGKPSIQDLSESSNLEHIADWIFSLRRSSEQSANETMIIDILKARRSEPKSWLLDWKLSKTTKFQVLREYREE